MRVCAAVSRPVDYVGYVSKCGTICSVEVQAQLFDALVPWLLFGGLGTHAVAQVPQL